MKLGWGKIEATAAMRWRVGRGVHSGEVRVGMWLDTGTGVGVVVGVAVSGEVRGQGKIERD